MSGDFARILVPTDSSPSSDRALAVAKSLALRFGASLHVIQETSASTIVSYAETHGIDLIVMGIEGQGAHGMLEHVVEQVVRLGPCPVLTVKPDRDLSAESSTGHLASTFV
jgi:nucleotide-binding universal stress UspA family protein